METQSGAASGVEGAVGGEVEGAESRRRALAKLGVGAVAIWAAPTVTTLRGSAVAAASQPGPTTTQPQETTTTTTAPAETTTTTTTAPPETTTTTTEPAGPVLDFNQPDHSGGYTSLFTPSPTYSLGVWQAFVAGRTGDLVRLELMIRLPTAGAGPISVAIHAADPTTGYPVGPAIGSGQLAEPAPASVPAAMTVEMSTPAPVVAGSTYVAVIFKASITPPSYVLSFGRSVTGFPWLHKYSYNSEPEEKLGDFTLYMKTYVA